MIYGPCCLRDGQSKNASKNKDGELRRDFAVSWSAASPSLRIGMAGRISQQPNLPEGVETATLRIGLHFTTNHVIEHLDVEDAGGLA